MEAGRWWRHFLSSCLTSSSAINRKQNKTETVLPVAMHRESVKILKHGVYVQAATEVSPQPPTEKKTDFSIEVAVYSTAYMRVK